MKMAFEIDGFQRDLQARAKRVRLAVQEKMKKKRVLETRKKRRLASLPDVVAAVRVIRNEMQEMRSLVSKMPAAGAVRFVIHKRDAAGKVSEFTVEPKA